MAHMIDKTLQKDLENILSVKFIPWEQIRGKTVFITGATGLIGYNLVNALLYANQKLNMGIRILALARNLDRAKARFTSWSDEIEKSLNFIIGSLEEFPEIEGNINYIIHAASETSSKAYVNQPVETIWTALYGTKNILELARQKAVEGMVYLSSMEVYGHPEKGHKVFEHEIGSLVPFDIRNSYPIGKLQCESLCCAYAKEYSVPVIILRLTQTFGPGTNYNDNRIFAYFKQCVDEDKNIILKTKGETERSYLYTADAVTAILTVMVKGVVGKAYNAADEDTYCSIAEMAEQIAGVNHLQVCYPEEDDLAEGYPETIYMDLDTTRLEELGWYVMGSHEWLRKDVE